MRPKLHDNCYSCAASRKQLSEIAPQTGENPPSGKSADNLHETSKTSSLTRRRIRPLPPNRQFQTCSIRVRPRNPFRNGGKLHAKPADDLIARHSERRTLRVRNQVINRQIIAIGLQPSRYGADIEVAVVWINRAKQSVLEYPVKQTAGRIVSKKIALKILGRQLGRSRLTGTLNGTGSQVASHCFEPSLGPGSNVVAGAAAGHKHFAARQLWVAGQEIDQARRSLSLFPRHIARLITRFPIRWHEVNLPSMAVRGKAGCLVALPYG